MVSAETRSPSPTLARRMLLTALNELDQQDGRSGAQIAEAIGVGTSTVLRWLRGANQDLKPGQVRLLCGAYGYGPEHEVTRHLVRLAQAAKTRGVTQPKPAPWMARLRFDMFLALERDATSMLTFESTAVPGLLQTEGYAAAVLRAVLPGAGDAEIEERVKVRVARQEVLHRADPLRLTAVLDEAVLCRVPGDRDAMRDQLGHLAEAAAWPNVTLRVLPFDAGPHAACATGPFVLMDFANGVHRVAYSENPASALYVETAEETARYEGVFDLLVEHTLDEEASAKRIAEARDAL